MSRVMTSLSVEEAKVVPMRVISLRSGVALTRLPLWATAKRPEFALGPDAARHWPREQLPVVL